MSRNREDDMGAKKMKERLEWGVQMVEEICKNRKMPVSEAIFIKGLEAGISMFIQSERNFSKN